MRCAAIDIGSNTTRLLVAERAEGGLEPVMERRAFTEIAASATAGGAIGGAAIERTGAAVASQSRLAGELGARAIRVVATAAIRDAPNRDEVVRAIGEACGRVVEVLDESEEGRLAFAGATASLERPSAGRIAVVDVGGGSSEIAFGTAAGGADAVRSFATGSGALARQLAGDPPGEEELRRLRERIERHFEGVELEQSDQALAVGGSATSTRRLVGPVLDSEALERGLRELAAATAEEIGARFDLDPRRVRILPAGVLLLEKVSRLLGRPLEIAPGGLREGVVLDLLGERAAGPVKRASQAGGDG